MKPSFSTGEIKSVLWFKDSEGTGRCVFAVYTRGDWYSYMGGDNLLSEVYAVKEEYAHVVLRYYNGILRFFVNGEGAGSSERSIDEGKVGNLMVGSSTFNSLLIEIFCERVSEELYVEFVTAAFNSLLIEIFCEKRTTEQENQRFVRGFQFSFN